MTKQQMIDKIYKVIADKEIEFWCKIKFLWNDKHNLYYDWTYIEKDIVYYKDWCLKDNIKLIWHPVMIWDVLDWLAKDESNNYLYIKDWDYSDVHREIMDTREEKRKPIENQNIECITFVYNLIR